MRMVKLADIAETIDYGYTASASSEEVGPRFLRITDIQNGVVNWETVPFCPCPEQKMGSYRLQTGDIVFARTGATTGKSFLINHCPTDAVFASYLIRVRPSHSRVCPDYLAHYFDSPQYWAQIRLSSTGSAQAGVNASKLKFLQIPLPPLPEQKRIAAILDKADAIRRKRQESIQLLDDLLKSTFLDMFGDPVANPKGWPVVPLTKLGKITTGNTPSRKKPEYFGNAIEWIKSDNLNSPCHILTQAQEGLSQKGIKVARIAPTGSSLITCIAGSPACIGNCGYADRDVAFNQQINAVTPARGINPHFLYCLILFSRRLIQQASTNSMKGMVNKSALSGVLMISVPESKQDVFAKQFGQIAQLRAKECISMGQVEQAFNSLSQSAFRGEL